MCNATLAGTGGLGTVVGAATLESKLETAREESLLESAVAAPQATMMRRRLISDPVEIAAAYLFYPCRNHPFVDGNKRVALATCLVALSANGLLPDEQLDVDAWESLTLDVAASRLDRARTAERLRVPVA